MQRVTSRSRYILWAFIVLFVSAAARGGVIGGAVSPPSRAATGALPRYVVTPLTAGWTSDAAFALSDTGHVVGQSHLNAFVWVPDAPNARSGKTILLPELSPDHPSAGLGVNIAGRAVGFSRDAQLRSQPVTWSPQYGGVTQLAARPGVIGGRANAINNAGVSVGATGLDATNMRVARWTSDGTLQDLGVPAGARYAFAGAINDAGVISGSAERNGQQVAFRFQNNQFSYLPLPGASLSSSVNWINSDGVVVGSANGAWWSDGTTSAYLADVPGAIATRAANGINDAGVVVGTAVVGLATVPTGAIWFHRTGPGYQLNSLIDPVTSAGYLVREAYAINNAGQIAVGAITPNGAYVAALLSPIPGASRYDPSPTVPEPALLATALPLVGLGWVRRPRRTT